MAQLGIPSFLCGNFSKKSDTPILPVHSGDVERSFTQDIAEQKFYPNRAVQKTLISRAFDPYTGKRTTAQIAKDSAETALLVAASGFNFINLINNGNKLYKGVPIVDIPENAAFWGTVGAATVTLPVVKAYIFNKFRRNAQPIDTLDAMISHKTKGFAKELSQNLHSEINRVAETQAESSRSNLLGPSQSNLIGIDGCDDTPENYNDNTQNTSFN